MDKLRSACGCTRLGTHSFAHPMNCYLLGEIILKGEENKNLGLEKNIRRVPDKIKHAIFKIKKVRYID